MNTVWAHDSSSCISLSGVRGKTTLDTAMGLSFGLWIVIADSVNKPGVREFCVVTVALNSQTTTPQIQHTKFAHLSFEGGVNVTFNSEWINNQVVLTGTTPETVNYTIYRVWSNLTADIDTYIAGGNFFCFTPQQGNNAQVFSPPIAIKLTSFYLTNGSTPNKDVTASLWLNGTTKLASVTVSKQAKLSPRVALNNYNISPTDYLTITMDNWANGVSGFVTW